MPYNALQQHCAKSLASGVRSPGFVALPLNGSANLSNLALSFSSANEDGTISTSCSCCEGQIL